MKVLTRKDKKCVWCGANMINAHCNEKYCNECKPLMKNGTIKKLIQKEEKQRDEQKKSEGPSLIEIVRLADAEGISYAKYCLKYGI